MRNNNIGFISVGQAGGNIGRFFEKSGFKVLYINSSTEDLKTLEGASFTYHITNGEGANKNRDKAKQLVIDDYDNIASQIDSVFTDCSLIYVIFASGGGTGSGAGPMLIDIMLNSIDKSVGSIVILPDKNESVKAMMNSYECLKELTNISNMSSCFILDNSRMDKFMINEIFVDRFVDFVSIPDNYASSEGNIDYSEIMESLKCHGAAQLFSYSGETDDVAYVINHFKEDIYPEAPKNPKYMAVVAGDSFDIDKLYTVSGHPYDVYRAYNDDALIILMSGMSFPLERFEEIYNIVNDNKDIVINANADKSVDFKSFDFLDEHVKKAAPEKELSRNDVLRKYFNK